MKDAAVSSESKEIPSPDRLIQTVLAIWETHGNAGTSVRSVAQATGLPVSSIYYHFGDMERLFFAAQDSARAAAEQWCAAHLDTFADAGALGAEALPALMAALIDDWSHAHRRLAFAWRECQIMAARDARYMPALQRWQALWQGFWQNVCARCGLPEHGELTYHLFDGESLLHLTQWRRAVDRACLEETCRGWGEWLAGRLVDEGPWRRFARTEASRLMPALSISGVVPEQVAAAAADTVAELGVSGLTHRAVARQAGLSLGVVSYNFRTSAELLRAAFEMIYRRVLPFTPQEHVTRTIEEHGIRLIDKLVDQTAPTDRLLAFDELLIAVARDPGLKPLSAQLRYLRGQTSRGLLEALLGPGCAVSPLDAALFSGLGSGQRRAAVGIAPEAARGHARDSMVRLLELLGPESG
ncbi:TetR/AcrR family transcriptional regulator [Novosphingobium album (ex Liu et al. 2023)]|uniref:TetR family transcriptional regulator n=1 Tax=Novosphingobium album (ex Liu et al. 2023) TaxID=3031130 RepID=A0ABT5WN83_9SPHN|nr:TetR family transcriptional regulator [Novosphingobium album (ex Liu et al. 2023)]MDE8651503.1 TetR family transcriptional regulator [Novosphingobium album (ex Liu et al. 2023)]